MEDSFQRDIPTARVNIKLDLHTGGALKRVDLPFKLLILGNFSNNQENIVLAECKKHKINRENIDAVLGKLNPHIHISIVNTLSDNNTEMVVDLSFKSMKDFHPEYVVRQVPELRALLAMRNLLCDLKSNLMDNVSVRQQLEHILKDTTLSTCLRGELEQIVPLGVD